MREILFRGKRVDNGKWVYGFYIENETLSGSLIPTIILIDEKRAVRFDSEGYNVEVFVTPETVGQYTGLKDKIGKKIFEGDIVRLQNLKLLYEIYWDKKEARYKARNGGCVSPLCNDYNVFVEEAVGNVFDNPELLEGEK